MDNDKMKALNEKINAFQGELAKEFGVVLQPQIAIVPVKQEIADAVNTSEEKIADAVSETTV